MRACFGACRHAGRLHGVAGMHEDYEKVSDLLEYDATRGSSIFACGGGGEEASLRRMQAAADNASKKYESTHADASVNSG